QVASREERAEGQLVRIFEATSVPPLLPERLMPSPRDLLWRASVSTVEGWEEYVRWERALLSQVFRLDSETSSLAKRLTAGAESTREKFDRLYHFVAQEIRYQQDYENTIAGVRPHACPVVVSRGYGDCKDKAVLLILLAKQVGIDVDFAILRTTDAGKVQREIPNQQFNHAIVYVPEQPGIPAGFFMDPTTDGLDMGNLRADDQGAWSLVLDPDSGTHRFLEIPYAPPTMERSVYRFSVEVQAPEEASAQFALETRGSGAASVRQLLRNPEQAKKLHQGLATRLFPGATVTGVQASEAEDIWNPLRLTLDLNVGAALQRQGDDVRLPVPELFPLGGTTTLQERAHPMRLGPPDSYESVTEVRIPPGGKVTHLPQQVEVSDPCFTLTRHTHRSERVITVKTEYVRTCAEIQTDEYVRYRSAVQRAQSQLADPLLFRLPPAKLAGHHLENGH
ncbi:MAG: transglutaminase-like domain-containing protein, partial [Myxococcota bacterium]